MKVVAIANQKGGVGKTTTSVNLAASLGAAGERVLLVDLDPQGNATMGSGVDKEGLEISAYEVLMGEATVDEAVRWLEGPRYWLLPSNRDLTGAEVGLLEELGREVRLRVALAEAQPRWDHVLIDCPPALNMLTVNALCAADSVLIPMQCEYYALEGLTALLGTIEKVRKVLNPRLRVEGLLRTMFDPRNNLSGQVSAQLVRHFGAKVYGTIIPRNVRLAEAPSHGLPALLYDRGSAGAQAYLALAAELLARQRSAREGTGSGAGPGRQRQGVEDGQA